MAQPHPMEELQDRYPDTTTCSSICSADSCRGNGCAVLGCDRCTMQSMLGTEACSLDACLNPNACESVECCREEACIHLSDIAFRRPPSIDDITRDYQDDFADFINYDTTDANDSMHCQWLETDHPCPVSATPAALSQHVFEAHIDQQALLPCEWDHCDQTVESEQLVEHVSQKHHPDQYVCLWQGCGYSFASDKELAAHMTTMHTTKLDCHWGGCEFIDMDPLALKSHVNDEHLSIFPGETFNQAYSDDLTAASSSVSGVYTPQLHETADLGSLTFPYELSKETHRQPLNSIRAPSGHTCLWMTDPTATTLCSATFTHENDLQAHLDRAHITGLTARGHSRQDPVFVCNWHDCKTERAPFNSKDKLRKHTWIHTRCEYWT